MVDAQGKMKLETEVCTAVYAEKDDLLPANFVSGNGRIISVSQDGSFGLVRVGVTCYASKKTFNFEVLLKMTNIICEKKNTYSQGAMVFFYGQPLSIREGLLVIDCKRLPQFVKSPTESRTVVTPPRKPPKGVRSQPGTPVSTPMVNNAVDLLDQEQETELEDEGDAGESSTESGIRPPKRKCAQKA